MNKCLHITVSGELPKDFLYNFVQKNAKELRLEGTAQWLDESMVRIIACGSKEAIDTFLDMLHKWLPSLENIKITPFLKEKDYRGVFRVIE